MHRAHRFVFLCAPPVAIALAAACSSSTPAAKSERQDEWAGETRDTTITHEACDTAGHEVKTFKGDSDLASGKSYVTRVYDGGREICSFSDLNGDGLIDVFTYNDASGKIRRREASFTVSRAIDEVALYENGEIKSISRDTNYDGKFDTWDEYEGGKLVRRVRDKSGDGRIDEWWTFQPGTDNATIVQADGKTGKPDPTQTVQLGAGANIGSGVGGTAVAPTSSVPPKASTSTAPSAAPEAGVLPGTEGLSPDSPFASTDAGAADTGADAGKPKKGKGK